MNKDRVVRTLALATLIGAEVAIGSGKEANAKQVNSAYPDRPGLPAEVKREAPIADEVYSWLKGMAEFAKTHQEFDGEVNVTFEIDKEGREVLPMQTQSAGLADAAKLMDGDGALIAPYVGDTRVTVPIQIEATYSKKAADGATLYWDVRYTTYSTENPGTKSWVQADMTREDASGEKTNISYVFKYDENVAGTSNAGVIPQALMEADPNGIPQAPFLLPTRGEVDMFNNTFKSGLPDFLQNQVADEAWKVRVSGESPI